MRGFSLPRSRERVRALCVHLVRFLSHCVLSGELGLSGFLPTVVCLERETP